MNFLRLLASVAGITAAGLFVSTASADTSNSNTQSGSNTASSVQNSAAMSGDANALNGGVATSGDAEAIAASAQYQAIFQKAANQVAVGALPWHSEDGNTTNSNSQAQTNDASSEQGSAAASGMANADGEGSVGYSGYAFNLDENQQEQIAHQAGINQGLFDFEDEAP